MNRKKILCWVGWYRNNVNDYKAIFIKKHIEIMAEFSDLHCFHIHHSKNLFWFKKQLLKEKFGDIVIYSVPAFFPLKLFCYLIIPLIEGIKARNKWGKIDVFHLHVSYPYAAFTLFLRFLDIQRWILTEHWSGYTFFDDNFSQINSLLKWLIKKKLYQFHQISVVSEYLKNQLVKRFPHLKQRIMVTPNVIVSPQTIVRKNNSNIFKLLTISNLINYPKNILFLLRVICEVSKELPLVQLDIYGDGNDKNFLVSECIKMGICNKNVFFKGTIQNEKISELYMEYNAFILLSKFETFSVVTAEAIAHGLPVIVSKCGGPDEYVNEKNGYLVPINDLIATKKVILDLYKNYSNFKPEDVQSTITKKFDISHIKQQLEKLIYD